MSKSPSLEIVIKINSSFFGLRLFLFNVIFNDLSLLIELIFQKQNKCLNVFSLLYLLIFVFKFLKFGFFKDNVNGNESFVNLGQITLGLVITDESEHVKNLVE